MKYDNMSDNEINVEVWAWSTVDDDDDNMLSGDPMAPLVTEIPDYCNSWADAGPIIEKHGISLYRIDENDNPFIKDEEVIGLWFSCGPMVAGYGDPEPIKDGLSCSNKNPLRAAMTSFLMMQEGK